MSVTEATPRPSAVIPFEGGEIIDHTGKQVIPIEYREYELLAETDERHLSETGKWVRSLRFLGRWSSQEVRAMGKTFRNRLIETVEQTRLSLKKPFVGHLNTYDVRYAAND